MGLFDGIDGISFGLEGFDRIEGVFVILPFDRFFCSECGFMDLGVRRAATDAAKHHALDTHGIGGAEDSSYVELAAHIIQHHHQRQFVRFAVLVHTHATHLGCSQFGAHSTKGK